MTSAKLPALKLYNTRTRSLDPFVPRTPPSVSLYCCGPTVYHFQHVGNMRTYIFEDLLTRTLRRYGYQVRHVMNITDVGHLASDSDEGEDKMLIAMRRVRSPCPLAISPSSWAARPTGAATAREAISTRPSGISTR